MSVTLILKFGLAKLLNRDPIIDAYCQGKMILDLGCSIGLKNLPRHFIGLDINKDILKQLVREGCRVIAADSSSLPFKNGVFDTVLCMQLIEHLEPLKAHQTLEEMSRVLMPKGKLVLSTPMPTASFWNTFTHVKPYPPYAIKKILTYEGGETYRRIQELKITDIFYHRGLGSLQKVTLLKPIGVFLNWFLIFFPWGSKNYTMILEKQ